MACLMGPRALRVLRAHVLYLLCVPYVPTRPMCSTDLLDQAYFTDQKIKKWKLCAHTF